MLIAFVSSGDGAVAVDIVVFGSRCERVEVVMRVVRIGYAVKMPYCRPNACTLNATNDGAQWLTAVNIYWP